MPVELTDARIDELGEAIKRFLWFNKDVKFLTIDIELFLKDMGFIGHEGEINFDDLQDALEQLCVQRENNVQQLPGFDSYEELEELWGKMNWKEFAERKLAEAFDS